MLFRSTDLRRRASILKRTRTLQRQNRRARRSSRRREAMSVTPGRWSVAAHAGRTSKGPLHQRRKVAMSQPRRRSIFRQPTVSGKRHSSEGPAKRKIPSVKSNRQSKRPFMPRQERSHHHRLLSGPNSPS